MEYIAKVTLYHNTKGLIKEGQTVELTKEEVAEYDKDYFNDLFEAVAKKSQRLNLKQRNRKKLQNNRMRGAYASLFFNTRGQYDTY